MGTETDPGVEPKNVAQWKEVFGILLNCDTRVVSLRVHQGILTVGTIGSPQYVTLWKGRESLEVLAILIKNKVITAQTERLWEIRRAHEATEKEQTNYLSRLQTAGTEAQRLMGLIPEEEIAP